MPSNELQIALNEIADLRALPQDVVIDALQSALVSAYRKFSGASNAQAIEARIDSFSRRARIFVEKEVVDSVVSPDTEVTLEKARYYAPESQFGDMVMVQVEDTPKAFGRIAAQTAKQVILQRIREAERAALYNEFVEREGDLMTGTVQSFNSQMVTLSLGRAEATLPRAQQIPNERYRQHEKLRVYIMEVKKTSRGPQIMCSRAHRNMLRRLLEYEVPEIYNGQVEIKSIAREAGYRSKVAVAALQEGIDPVGACVGMRGIRIQNIVKELHDEKIDVIEWNPVAEGFITKALSPARVTGVYLEEDDRTGQTAVVIVPDDQLSLAIGREGQNARLAAKLTGWRIDIKSVTETVQNALDAMGIPPLDSLPRSHGALIEDVRRIMGKKVEGKTVMSDEYETLSTFADLVERQMLERRNEERRSRQREIESVKATVPPAFFKTPVSALGLKESITEALQPLGSIGQVMVSLLLDETHLRELISDDAVRLVQSRLDELVVSGVDDLISVAVDDYEPEDVMVLEVIEEEPLPAVALVAPIEEVEEEEELRDAFGGVIEVASPSPAPIAQPEVATEVAFDDVDFDDYVDYNEEDEVEDIEVEDGEVDDLDPNKPKKKDKQKRRQLILDEESGQVRAKRQRKGGRQRAGWNDEFDI